MRLGIDGRELREDVRTGIRRYVLEVARAAVARGAECVVYGDWRTRVPAELASVTLRVLPTPSTRWWDQVALPRALRRDRIDVLLSPYYKRPLRAPCPTVISIHDLFFIGYPGRRRPVYDRTMTWLARLYAAGAAAIIADSEHSRQAIVTRLGVPAERIVVVPVGLGREFTPAVLTTTQRQRYRLRDRYVLYVGNFLPHKNVPRLLDAWAALPAALRASHGLALAGGDAARREALAARAKSLGIEDSVVFPGLIADADLPALYSAAAVVVLPSLEEGFGLPALEAMACGAPVIASRRGALPEVVADAGLLVEAEDERALATALARVLTSEPERTELRRRSRVRAAQFTAERTAGRVVDLLASVAGRTPALARTAG